MSKLTHLLFKSGERWQVRPSECREEPKCTRCELGLGEKVWQRRNGRC